MKLKLLFRVWILLSITFIGLVLVLISYTLLHDWTIITKPLQTSVALTFIIPYAIILLYGKVLLDKARKRDLEIG